MKVKGKDFEVEARNAVEVAELLKCIRDHEAAGAAGVAPAALPSAITPTSPVDCGPTGPS